MAEGCGEVSEGLSRLRITEEGVPEGVLEEGQEEGQEAVPRRYSGMADSEGSSSDTMAEGGEGETANVGEESSGESDEEEVCRLCEQSIPRKLLANHLVACTATHSCLEKISKVISSRLAPHYTHTLAPHYTPPPLFPPPPSMTNPSSGSPAGYSVGTNVWWPCSDTSNKPSSPSSSCPSTAPRPRRSTCAAPASLLSRPTV